jgi:hypothetical protein
LKRKALIKIKNTRKSRLAPRASMTNPHDGHGSCTFEAFSSNGAGNAKQSQGVTRKSHWRIAMVTHPSGLNSTIKSSQPRPTTVSGISRGFVRRRENAPN